MTRLRTIPEMLGCGDHGCVFEKPTGMGTNGGCRCLMDVRDPSVRVPLRRKIVAQREVIKEQRAEIERLEWKAEMVEETIGAYLAADSSKRNICELIALVDPANDQ